MPKIQLRTPNRVQRYCSPHGTEVHDYFGERAPLHLQLVRIAPGESTGLGPWESDVLAFVWKGVVQVLGVPLPKRSTMIVERSGGVQVLGGADGASLLLFSARAQAHTRDLAGAIHILPSSRVPRTASLGGDGSVGGALYADAQSLGLPLWLHENEFRSPGFEVGIHSHSEDEIIFVQEGEIVLGKRTYGPGTALAIAANTKYGFHVGPRGLDFINFRASSPTYTSGDGLHHMDEGSFWREAAGVPIYLRR